MKFVEVCTTDAIPTDEAVKIDHGGTAIAVFNTVDGFFAVDGQCTHGEWSLCEGYIEHDVVECPLHGAKFCLRTGEVLAAPATRPLHVFPIKIENDLIFVDVEGGHYAVDPEE